MCVAAASSGCAYWTNPDSSVGKVHLLSRAGFCAKCNLEIGSCTSDLCACEDITDSDSLIDCSIKRETKTTFQQENPFSPSLVQTTLYNKNGLERSVAIKSPAHNGLEEMEYFMHSDNAGSWATDSGLRNNRLFRIGNVCIISSIYGDRTYFPPVTAFEIQAITKGNPVSTSADEYVIYSLIIDSGTGTLTPNEKSNLHPDIISQCSGLDMRKIKYFVTLSYAEAEQLADDKIITQPKNAGSTCLLRNALKRQHSGGSRFPARRGQYLWFYYKYYTAQDTTCCENPVGDPACCQEHHQDLCECKSLTDEEKTIEQCSVPQRGNALFVATGETRLGAIPSVEILVEDDSGNYIGKQVDNSGCTNVPDFPMDTSSAVGAIFNGMPTVCVGKPGKECFGFGTDGSWTNTFSLAMLLEPYGSSVSFKDRESVNNHWMITSGDKTEVWGKDPPEEMSNGGIQHPFDKLNKPCIAMLDDDLAFVTGTLKDDITKTLTGYFNVRTYSFAPVQAPNEVRIGPACGFLQHGSFQLFVLAGGYKSSTTEIYIRQTGRWTRGPRIGFDLYGASMVPANGNKLLLVGGYNVEYETFSKKILKWSFGLESWTECGEMTNARSNAVALSIPFENLPQLC